jgi:predicted phage-related endonuclease
MSEYEEEAVQAALDPIADLFGRFLRARELRKRAEELEKESKEILANYLIERGAEYGTVGNKMRLRYREVVSNRFDVKRFRAENPEVAEAYSRQQIEHRMEIIDD